MNVLFGKYWSIPYKDPMGISQVNVNPLQGDSHCPTKCQNSSPKKADPLKQTWGWLTFIYELTNLNILGKKQLERAFRQPTKIFGKWMGRFFAKPTLQKKQNGAKIALS